MTLPRLIALYDTETTGLDPAVDTVIEAAVVLYDLENACPITSFSSLIHGDSNAAEATNRISPKALAGGMGRDAVWTSIHRLMAKADLVMAHHAGSGGRR